MTSATKLGQSWWTPLHFLSDPHSDSEAGDGREHLPLGSDPEKVPSDPGATLWGMVETVAHFPANDWDDVITFKTVFEENPWHSSERSQLQLCFG